MRVYVYYLEPALAGLLPALACLAAVWTFGDSAQGVAVGCAMSMLAGAVAFVALAQRGLALAAQSLAQAVEQGAGCDYSDGFDAAERASAFKRLFSPLERLRAAMKQRETDLLADIESRALESKQRKKAADAEAQGYMDAHELFMKTFTAALTAMAGGDLSVRLEQPYSRDYEALRHCFNKSIDSLNKAFGASAQGVHGLRGAVEDITAALAELSDRTGQQAAHVEEASATLRSIVDALGQTAAEAKSAARTVASTRNRAEVGAGVVGQAIEAMRRIQNSSGEIVNIISVIDEIAFQTNLLALNAGVEAARAGESGKGFAVVASEVRALALRSAEAAKQIKALIAASSAQVKEGVDLVGETGAALGEIVRLVEGADTTVAAIAEGASGQKTMLTAIDEAVRQLDLFTQANAAMVDSTNQSARAAGEDAADIAQAVSRFRLRAADARVRAAA